MKYPFRRSNSTPTSSDKSSPLPPIDNQKFNRKSITESDKVPFFAWEVLFILSAIAAMVMYAETMISISIPEIIREFDISYNTS